jgi:chemotaxis-related protein WspD
MTAASWGDTSPGALDDCWNRVGVRGDRSCPELQGQIHCRNCPVFSAAARVLLDVPAPDGSRQRETEHFARPELSDSAHQAGIATLSVMVFRLRAEWYAIHTTACLEIADLRPIHPLPHRRDAAMLGLVNVRGNLLVCISLAAILGVADQPEVISRQLKRIAPAPRLLVTKGEAGPVVFPVDEVQGMERFGSEALKPVPTTIAQAQASYTQSLLILGDKTIGLLDERRLLHKAERVLA